MEKKGISEVIGTVLILGLSLVVISIVWVAITNIVNTKGEDISVGRVNLNLRIVGVSIENGELVVNVLREKGIGDLKGIKFILESSEGQKIIDNESSLEEFDSAKFRFYLDNLDNLSKVSVAPILSSGSTGIKDVWEKPKGGIKCVPSAPCPDNNTLCVDNSETDDCGNNCMGILEPDCPSAEIINCGEEIISNNKCGTCEGKGIKCGRNFFCEEGFCKEKLRIFVTSSSFNGNLGGLSGADQKCLSDSNNPDIIRTWKAFIGTFDRQVSGIDWILKPNTNYYRNDSVTLIAKTNSNSWFDLPLNNSITLSLFYIFSGLNSTGSFIHPNYNCNNWVDSTISRLPYYGFSNSVFASFIWNSNLMPRCNSNFRLYCVEQPSN